eukprot:6200426-Pleurochrysis_carterae.AAC.2
MFTPFERACLGTRTCTGSSAQPSVSAAIGSARVCWCACVAEADRMGSEHMRTCAYAGACARVRGRVRVRVRGR